MLRHRHSGLLIAREPTLHQWLSNCPAASIHDRPHTGPCDGWRFDSLLEARVIIEDWRIDYNLNRPHSAHGDLTPSEFASAWTDRHQPVLA